MNDLFITDQCMHSGGMSNEFWRHAHCHIQMYLGLGDGDIYLAYYGC